jgi:ribose transport system permease protein
VLGIGLLIGLFNGVLVVKLKLEPLVGSLGVMTLIMGIYFVYTQGFPKGNVPPSIRYIGTGWLFGFFPVPVLIWAVIAAAAIFILRRTVFGKRIYATGANPKAAYLVGIKTDWILMSVYLISGFLTALAGVIWAGYLGSATLDGGAYFPLDSIAAVIIGGTIFAGGKGGIGGTIVGAIIMYYLASFLTVVGLGVAAKLILQGALILLLVYSYTGRNK